MVNDAGVVKNIKVFCEMTAHISGFEVPRLSYNALEQHA